MRSGTTTNLTSSILKLFLVTFPNKFSFGMEEASTKSLRSSMSELDEYLLIHEARNSKLLFASKPEDMIFSINVNIKKLSE